MGKIPSSDRSTHELEHEWGISERPAIAQEEVVKTLVLIAASVLLLVLIQRVDVNPWWLSVAGWVLLPLFWVSMVNAIWARHGFWLRSGALWATMVLSELANVGLQLALCACVPCIDALGAFGQMLARNGQRITDEPVAYLFFTLGVPAVATLIGWLAYALENGSRHRRS